MQLLVDFDNLHRSFEGKSSIYRAESIVDRLHPMAFKPPDRIRIKLCVGWYEENRMTRKAQRLAADIQKSFPRPHVTKAMVNMELAYSLEVEPSRHLWHTLRARSHPMVCGARIRKT